MTIEFATDAQRITHQHVAAILKEEYGRQARTIDDQPVFVLPPHGSAIATVGVEAWGEDASVVRVWSMVVLDAEQSPELHRFLLERNTQVLLGAFALQEDGGIVFQSTLIGEGMQPDHLLHAVRAVLFTADAEDDSIVSRYGGRRMTDRTG